MAPASSEASRVVSEPRRGTVTGGTWGYGGMVREGCTGGRYRGGRGGGYGMRCTPRPRRRGGVGTPHRCAPGREAGHSCRGGGVLSHACVLCRTSPCVPCCTTFAALHNACRAAAHAAAHYTAPHALCCTALLCSLHCTLCTMQHRSVCALPHRTMLCPTPVPHARQHRVEGTLGLVPAQPTSAPSPLEGRWGCCTSCICAATHVPHSL